MVKNLRIRRKMVERDISQEELGKMFDPQIGQHEVSIMLKRELSKSEQDEIIKTIEEAQDVR